MSRLRCPLLVMTSISLAYTSQAALVVSFETSGQLLQGFDTAASGTLLSQSSSGGLSDSGALIVPESADNQLWISVDAFAGNTDNVFSFYFKTPTSLDSAGYLSFGAVSSPDAGTSTGLSPSSVDYLGGNLNPDSGDFELEGEGAFNNAGNTLSTAMESDSWYFVELTYDWQFNQTYSLQLRINESDDTGIVGASMLSGGVFNAGLESGIADDATTYLYFGGGSLLDNAVAAFDDLSSDVLVSAAVPEPATVGLFLGLTGLSGLVLRRRMRVR